MRIKSKTLDKIISFALLLPSLLAIGVFVYGFIGKTVQISLLNWNSFSKLLARDYDYVGLRNYIRLFSDPRFQSDLWNTLFFTLLFLIGCLAVGITLAVLVDKGLKGSFVFQNIFLFPMALSFVVTGTIWRWIFAPGVENSPQGINLLLHHLGLDSLRWGWFTSTEGIGPFNLALIPLAVAAMWQFSGYVMAMWLAGLRGIPDTLIEAAKVDGATSWQIFRHIYFPLLKPITYSAMIVLGHISLKIFDLVYSMTGSGPNFVTDVPAMYMFETTFRGNRYSTGSSIAVVMLAMVSVVIIPYLVSSLLRKEVR